MAKIKDVIGLVHINEDYTFTIPEYIMEQLGLKPGDSVEFSIIDGVLTFSKKREPSGGDDAS